MYFDHIRDVPKCTNISSMYKYLFIIFSKYSNLGNCLLIGICFTNLASPICETNTLACFALIWQATYTFGRFVYIGVIRNI